ncbi:hypothetical protein [Andreprevotia sp. IGB-42]|uniref:hypothetical protein n=1 Tax=Andreprevotia sp. IGB-42 TaxID=2497473 RepID=UPI00135B953A|nr:hypothetical protein [Andreprevotia sp. IGB-42]
MSSRRAALALHGLAEADQSWMLAQLGVAARARVGAHLEELVALGIPAEPSLALSAGTNNSAAKNVDQAASIDKLLMEPTWLLALLVRQRNWWWQEALLGRMDGQRRADLERLVAEDVPVAPALARALLLHCEEQLAADMPRMNATQHGNLLAALKLGISRWRR